MWLHKKKIVDVYVTSAFSKNGEGGNKAGVVLGRLGLEPSQKMEIAKRFGYSETVFVSDSDKADLKLQYFTPTKEVTLCGHATILKESIRFRADKKSSSG